MDDKRIQDLLRRASPQTWEWAPACPDEHEIAAYVDGSIPEPARETVEAGGAGQHAFDLVAAIGSGDVDEAMK